jgi:hypothetical protein
MKPLLNTEVAESPQSSQRLLRALRGSLCALCFGFLFCWLPSLSAQTIPHVTGIFKTPGNQTPTQAGLRQLTAIAGTPVYGSVDFTPYDPAANRPTRVLCGGTTFPPQPVRAWVKGDGTLVDDFTAAAGVNLVPTIGCQPDGLVIRATIVFAPTQDGFTPSVTWSEDKQMPQSASVDWGAQPVAGISALTYTGYNSIQNEGTPLTGRATVNMIGSGVDCADNPGSLRTDCTVTGGGGGGTPCVTTALSWQYNNAGNFGCMAQFTYSGSTGTVGTGGILTWTGTGIVNARKIANTEFTNAESLGKIPIGQGDGTAVWADPLVQGTTAHDAVGTATNPVLIGGYASAAAPADVSADGDATRAWLLRNGSPVVNLASGGTLITLGQKTMSASFPVVLASDQSGVLVNQGSNNATPWNLQGIKTNNNAAPGATNFGALGCLANAANPSWTEGNLVLNSCFLNGAQRNDITTIAGTAPTTVGKLDVKGADGDVFVRQATGTNLHTVLDSGTVTTVSTVTNLSQQGGVAISLNTGVRDTGTQRVTIATNDLVPVSGTFWQATQPVSGTFWQATQPVSGTVTVTDGAGALNVICDSGCAGGTQYAEDTAHVTGDTLTLAGVVQQAADAALSGDGDRSLLQVDANGFLKVNIKAGAGSGGTAAADNSVFTGGSTNVTPMGALYDTTPPAVTDGNIAAPRMDSNRYLFTNCVVGCSGGATTPADAFANPTTAGIAMTFNAGYNGATWDLLRSGDKNNVAAVVGVLNTAPLARYNATQPTLTDTRYNLLQASSRGELLVAPGVSNFAVQATLSAETTKAIGVVRTADGAGNLLTSNSIATAGKFGLDANILSILGTAPTTAGKLDVKGADGDIFVRQATAANFNGTFVGTRTNNNAVPGATNFGAFGCIANAADPSWTETNLVGCSVDLSGFARTKISNWLGSTAPTVGSKTSANSIPIVIASDQGSFPVAATLNAETTKAIGVVRTADGAGNLLTSNSTTYTAKFGLDANLLGTLGTAFSTAGKVDVKGADGDVFVRQATAANFNGTFIGTLTNNNAVPVATNFGALTALANAAAPTWTEGRQVLLSTDLAGALRVSGSAGGGVAQTQVRNVANAWTDVGYSTGNLSLPVQEATAPLLLDAITRLTNTVKIDRVIGDFGRPIGSIGDALKVALPPALDPCEGGKGNVAISQTASTKLVSGVGGMRILMCYARVVAGVAEVFSFTEGSGAACATGTLAVTGSTTAANGESYAANGGMSGGMGRGTIAASNRQGNDLCLSQNGSNRLSGNITFVYAP